MNPLPPTLSESDRAALLALVAEESRRGSISAQAPELFFDGEAITSRLEEAMDDADDDRLERWFAEGLLAWKTNKGPLYTLDCCNPATGRVLSGTLFMTQRTVTLLGDDLYALYAAVFEDETLNTEPCSRAEWERMMRKEALPHPPTTPVARPPAPSRPSR